MFQWARPLDQCRKYKGDFTKKGEKIVEPFSLQDSSMMANLAKANCLIVREPFDKKRKKGDTVKIIKLDTCF